MQLSEHQVQRSAYLVRLNEAQQSEDVLRRGAAAHFVYLRIHDSELPVIDGKRNKQARNSYHLSDYLKFLKRIHFVKPILARLCLLTTNDIDDRENNDPDRIHEMPVPRDHLDVFVMRFLQVTSQAQEQDQHQQRQPHDNVSGVQANQRIESGAEQ